MAFLKEISQAIVSTKRRLDDANECELDEFKKPKTVIRKYPLPKIRIGVQFIRDFPLGCGILHDEVERKPLKKLDNFDSNIGNLTSYAKYKMANSQPFESNKLDSFKTKELGFNNLSFSTKPSNKQPTFASTTAGKVKLWDPTSSKEDYIIDVLISKDTNTFESHRRQKLREAMILYETEYTQLSHENRSKQKGEKIVQWRVPTESAKIAKQKLKWINPNKTLGQIQGVRPGDKFKFRPQLQMIGLHCQPHCGIDYTEINGKNLAISIVDSHRYSNESRSCGVLSYCGEGGGSGVQFGFGFSGSKRHVALNDQKLERGNLALKNSMNEKSPVRVIRKVFGVGRNNYMFVYDGLYTVKDCTQKRSSEGKMLFMFQLHKIPGQPHLHKMVNVIPGDVASYHYSTFQMPV